MPVAIATRVEISALPGVPVIEPGDDLAALLWAALERAAIALDNGDVLVLASTLVSRAEDRFVDLSSVVPGPRAQELAQRVGKDARLVELILADSEAISRVAPGVIIVRHRLGFISANAAIDQSNSQPAHARPDSGPWILRVPEDPDASAARIRAAIEARARVKLGVIISDSLGRPFRHGTVGAAIGVAGVPALSDMRGRTDLHGRALEYTITALADQIAASADLLAGQADEGRGAILWRGIVWDAESQRLWGTGGGARELCRAADEDLYA